MKGYGKRLGGSVADNLIGNFLTESVMPSLLREDPRYFRRGRGGVGHEPAMPRACIGRA